MILEQSQSLCPECLRLVDAYYIQEGNEVFLVKECLEHGQYKTLIWENQPEIPGSPDFSKWVKTKKAKYIKKPITTVAMAGQCPFVCGLCPEHKQETCCALIEVTKNCNMLCPVCFASAKQNQADLSYAEITQQIDFLFAQAGACNLQLSGGEPTVREDLPKIIAYARTKAFALLQLNSNGLRLAQDLFYAQELKSAGLDVVYLQFDGTEPEIYAKIRGQDYLEAKKKAIANCMEAGLAVVLVATVVRGVNEHNLGDILRFALTMPNLVRGVHFQPMAFFGRYPKEFQRLTLSSLMLKLAEQSPELVQISDFHGPNAEHSLCSFSALYQRKTKGLEYLNLSAGCCDNSLENTKNFVAQHWQASKNIQPNLQNDFDKFLQKTDLAKRFTISAMAFQDSQSLDIERLRNCHIHVVSPDSKLIPFCAYNLTSQNTFSLYRK